MSIDEELQDSVEKGLAPDNSLDAKAYRKVFSVLKKEPFELPGGFADRVIQRIGPANSLVNDYIWIGVGLTAILLAAIVAIMKVNFKPDFGALKFINGYSGLFVFGIVFILLIHLFDKNVLRSNDLQRDRRP